MKVENTVSGGGAGVAVMLTVVNFNLVNGRETNELDESLEVFRPTPPPS